MKSGLTVFDGFIKSFIMETVDQKTGRGSCLFVTRQRPALESMVVHKEEKRGVMFYTLLCRSDDMDILCYEPDFPLTIRGVVRDDIPADPTYKALSFEILDAELVRDTTPDMERLLHVFLSMESSKKLAEFARGDIYGYVAGHRAADFAEAAGIQLRKAAKVFEAFARQDAMERMASILTPHGIPNTVCLRAVKAFGPEHVLTQIQKDPYESGRSIGLTFAECDMIAQALGLGRETESRVRAIAQKAIDQVSGEGHTWLPYELFKRKFEWIAGKGSLGLVGHMSALKRCVGVDRTQEGMRVYDPLVRRSEKRAARNVARLSRGEEDPAWNSSLVDYAEKECGISYGPQQKRAFSVILGSTGMKILTGGPGTGKTTTIKGILLAYRKMHPDNKVCLCAPTGRAAQRMSESTGFPASTIHKAIGYIPYGRGEAEKNANNQIDAELFLIDESSMVDTVMFSMLLEAIPSGSVVVLVGDVNQLEAVGPGSILLDLIGPSTDGYIGKARLTDVYRQKGGSPIIENAVNVTRSKVDIVTAPDFEEIRTRVPEQTLEVVKSAAAHYYDPEDPFGTQVLCPSRKGRAGINVLNEALQEMLNPRTPDKKFVRLGKREFREGDKVMLVRNNYQLDYYNGDVGVIKRIWKGDVHLVVRGKTLVITRDLFDDLQLAYAMTIHKSQGSEFTRVILSMSHETDGMLARNLYYTGITRAKKHVIVVNEQDAVRDAIVNDRTGQRQTMLLDFLKEERRNI